MGPSLSDETFFCSLTMVKRGGLLSPGAPLEKRPWPSAGWAQFCRLQRRGERRACCMCPACSCSRTKITISREEAEAPWGGAKQRAREGGQDMMPRTLTT